MRATRRLDQMRVVQKETIGLNRGLAGAAITGFLKNPLKDDRPTLASQGIDKNLANQMRRLGAMSDEKFEATVSDVREAVSRAVKSVINMDGKADARSDRERDLAANQRALPSKKYGVIYADPEWRFEVYSQKTGMDRSAENHYPTSPTDEICARPVSDIAADDCVLFLCATAPMLPDALRVMEAWGFKYKSQLIWRKDHVGTGYWFRNGHELLLVGTRGKVPAPAPGTQFDSVINAPKSEHSEKPDRFYEIIEAYFPNLPKIELNARRARAGWDRWGNEAPEADPLDIPHYLKRTKPAA
jgi:N6-adenosine-specific RNA methylase IME4